MNLLFLAQAPQTRQSTQHRMKSVCDEFARRGHDCTFVSGTDYEVAGRAVHHASPAGLKHIFTRGRSLDYLLVNRDGSPISWLAFSIADLHGVPIVYDIDDAIFRRYRIAGTRIPNPVRLFLNHHLRQADVVTAGNGYIRDYAAELNECVVKLPTPVNTDIFSPNINESTKYEKFVVGWMGGGPAHTNNLPILKEPLVQLGEEYDVRFRIISSLGHPEIKATFQDIEDVVTVDYGFDEWVPIEDIAREMQTFDIAALPLNLNDDFMKGKSVIKVLEHLATKTPVVVSDAGVYGDVVTHDETGLLADSSDEWYRAFRTLADSPAKRERLAQSGFEMVQKNYTLEVYVDKLESLLLHRA